MTDTLAQDAATKPSLFVRLKSYRTQIVAAIFWTLAVIAIRQYMQANDLTFTELTRQFADLLTGTWYGPLLYIVVYLLRPLILFPASLLAILAGSIYGLAWGFVYGLFAGTASALLPYAAGRWFAGEDARQQALDDDAQSSLMTRFIALLRHNPFQAVLMMRLLYLPYDPVSFAVGALRIAFLPFFTATLIGNIGGSFSFVGLGASIEGDITSGDISINPAIFALTVVILIASFGLSRWLNQREAQRT